jgi:hypothetical protein
VSAVTEDWKAQARELRESGLSEREVAESVGKAASTVHAYFKREGIEVRADAEPGPSNEAAESEPQPDAVLGDPVDEPDAPSQNGNGHLSPYHAERSRLEDDLHNNAGGGGAMRVTEEAEAQGRIGDSGDTEWESESVYVPLTELRVDGTAQLGLFAAGGKRPQDSSLRLQGGRVLLADGQAFKKGDVVRLEVTAVVREVAQRDKPDPATGIVVSAEQKHVAYITDLRVIS